MIPDNVLSTKAIQARFLYPDGIIFNTILEDYEKGGIALQDASKGINYQPWFGWWVPEDETAWLYPNLVNTPVAIFTESNVFEFSFTFDQNMRWVAGVFLNDGTFKLRWYDSMVESYVITEMLGVTAFKLCHDDKRDLSVQGGQSDVLFTYIRNNKLYIRTQRERFAIEHLLQENLPNNLLITNFGMHERLRVQWRMRYRNPGELLPWLIP